MYENTAALRLHVRKVIAELRKDVVKGFSVEDGSPYGDALAVKVRLDLYDGPSIRFHVTYNDYQAQGKLRIQGDYQTENLWDFRYRIDGALPDINITPTRPILAQANDLARRFLETFRPIYWKLLEHKAANGKHVEAVNANVDNLLTVEGVRLVKRSEQKDTQGAVDFYRRDNLASGDVQVFGESCNLKLNSIPVDVAREILALVLAKNVSIIELAKGE